MAGLRITPLPDAEIEMIARELCNDAAARHLAHASAMLSYDRSAERANLISAAVASKMTPEFVEKQVNSRLEKLVVEAVDSALCRFSNTGKMIEKAVHEALRVDRLDLPSYGSVVAGMLKSQIESQVSVLVAGKLAEDMAELLSIAPSEIKLSEIADGMRERHVGSHDHAYGPIISIVVEESPLWKDTIASALMKMRRRSAAAVTVNSKSRSTGRVRSIQRGSANV